MTNLHVEFSAVVDLSNRWFAVDPSLWRAGLAIALAHDRTLLALIYQRLRTVRDDVARQAFTEQRTIAEIARERLAARGGVAGRDRKGPLVEIATIARKPLDSCAKSAVVDLAAAESGANVTTVEAK